MLTRFQSIRFNSDTALVTTFGVLAALAFLISFRLENPFMMAAFSAAPLLLCLTWQRPFLMCVLFVAVSYFRLHEAYPFLGPVKLAFSFGALAVGLTAVKALLSRGRNDDVSSSAMLRSACIVSLALAAGLATLQSLTANLDGVSAGNVVLIPATIASSVMCAFFWLGFLNNAGPHEFPVNIRLFVAYFAVVSVTLVFGYIPAASFSVWTGTTLKRGHDAGHCLDGANAARLHNCHAGFRNDRPCHCGGRDLQPDLRARYHRGRTRYDRWHGARTAAV